MIPVTKPFLPPIDAYEEYLKSIWQREWLTNNGPLVKELELELQRFLGTEPLLYLGNGTIALQMAIKALGLKGEIVTTPFSYVATTSSIFWEGCKPVFADIDKDTFNIDPLKIEEVISPETTAILATHCFGNPCDIDAIQKIADRNGLKVIYDAAHCFGTNYQGKSVYNFGDISTASFHATKVFHSIEGGAVFTSNQELYDSLKRMRNFGHDGPDRYSGVGINGKNSEFHAAMGLLNLKWIEEIIAVRKQQYDLYSDELVQCKGVSFQFFAKDSQPNKSYFPIVLESEKQLMSLLNLLSVNEIQPRRYFYPSLNCLEYLNEYYNVPVSLSISNRIICLPLYHTMTKTEQNRIIDIIASFLEKN